MKPDHARLLHCVDCHGSLMLAREVIVDGVLRSGLLQCQHCARAYPVVNHVLICFRREDLGNYLTESERQEICRLNLDAALEGLEHAPTGDGGRQRQVAENWEFQHREVFRFEEFLEDENYHGLTMFRRFIPIEFDALEGKRVCCACVGRGKEAHHGKAAIHLLRCFPIVSFFVH